MPSEQCPLQSVDAQPGVEAGFVAINYIDCKPHFRERFECLFCTRAHAIDRMPGFLRMKVLRALDENRPYLILSEWTDEASFRAWVGSPEFIEGHKRGFEELAEAKKRGEEPPMTSDFVTYTVIAN